MTPDEELLDTIEEIRRDRFPNLSAALVKAIVATEQEFPDNRSEAFRRISDAIDEQLSRKGEA
jgi:uncharacterized protein involved in exopolysaccharide biosynthesis